MEQQSRPGVTTLLARLEGDRHGGFAALVQEVYDDIRGIAERRLKRVYGNELGGLTNGVTPLTNDVIMELKDQRQQFVNRQQFFALATRLTIRQLAEYQRHRLAQKRGGGRRGGELNEAVPVADDASETDADMMLHALADLKEIDERAAEVVTLHIFCDMPLPLVAENLGISIATAERDWRFAKNWLAEKVGERG